MPGCERQRFGFTLHVANGFGTSPGFADVKRDQEARVGVGFQKADLVCPVSLTASASLMTRPPNTFLKRALKSGMATLAPFFRAAGTRSQATVCPRLVTSSSSPAWRARTFGHCWQTSRTVTVFTTENLSETGRSGKSQAACLRVRCSLFFRHV